MRVAALALTACLLAGPARAAIYENTIVVDAEEDLFEMQQRGDISDDTFDTLMELLQEGVDLNSATREQLYDLPGLTYTDVDAILDYRALKGRIEDPSELVGAGALTGEQLVQMAPFIRLDAAKPLLPVSGKLRVVSRIATSDTVPPPVMFNARLKGPLNLSAGVMAFTTRRRAASPTYDPNLNALTSPGFLYTPQLPRFFVQWKPGNARLVAGTFTIGFAERLTLDNTRRITPRGIYLVDDYRRPPDLSSACKLSGTNGLADPSTGCDVPDGKALYITPDFAWRESFRGVAGSIEDLPLGSEASLSLYGFASYQQRSLYQYQVFDRRTCENPADDSADCAAPQILLAQDPSVTLMQSTLDGMFDELTGGGHVSFKPNYRFTLGATGYVAVPFFRQAPYELDFQEYSRYPTGGAFGAVGLDAQASWKGLNFFLEGAHNFDNRPGTGGRGGWGVEQRTTFSPKGHELELSLRLYDPGFGTPYARPIAGPDVENGQRARNEGGLRLRYFGKFSKDWNLRARANFWVNPWAVVDTTTAGSNVVVPAGTFNVDALARIDFDGWNFFQPALLGQVRATGGVYSAEAEREAATSADELSLFLGDYYRVGARIDVRPWRRLLQFNVQGSFYWRRYGVGNTEALVGGFGNDLLLAAEVRSQPLDALALRARVRYVDRTIQDPTNLETSLWSLFEVSWLIGKGAAVVGRYDNVLWLDRRDSTPNRVPNPEHRFQLDARVAF